MIKVYTANTSEIDDIDIALDELFEQLPPASQLLKNTIGLVSCFADFVESGVVCELCDKLPFEVIGATTLCAAANGGLSETILTLTVLTSDDISFVTALTDEISGEDARPLKAAYDEAINKVEGLPAFMVGYIPLLVSASGDFFVECMDEVTNGLANFCTVAVDHNRDYHDSQVIYNGKTYRDRYTYVIVCGDIVPKFFIGSISNEKVFTKSGVITASSGNLLESVNGVSVLEFCKSIGLKQADDGSIEGINSFPLIVDYNDGTKPVMRSMFTTTPEGYAVCGGRMPVGATISVGAFDAKEVLNTTRSVISGALECAKNGMIIFSCVGRFFSQGFNPLAEAELVSDLVGDKAPFAMSYSSGEVCPVYDKDSKTVNRSHNDTIIVCAF